MPPRSGRETSARTSRALSVHQNISVPRTKPDPDGQLVRRLQTRRTCDLYPVRSPIRTDGSSDGCRPDGL
eukprot:1114867-Prymnesium_polylepis.1